MRKMRTWVAFLLLIFGVASKRPSEIKLELHHEAIVARWLNQAHKLNYHGLTPESLAHRIVSASGWPCYATLVQLHLGMDATRVC